MNKRTIATGVTFAVFMAEAMIHYNIGVQKNDPEKKIVFPPSNDLLKIIGTVAFFSFLNGYLISKI